MKPSIGVARACIPALFLALGLAASQRASALNGNVYVQDCATCNTVAEFVAHAVSHATFSAQAGTYVVSSQTSPRTAFVSVTGNRRWVCDRYGENCEAHLYNAFGRAVDYSGAPVASDGTLDAIDQAFFASRRNNVFTIGLSPTFQSSFINSFDVEVGPGIDQALLLKGIKWNELRNQTIVRVRFPDGTSALYIKEGNLSYHWVWTGLAWDATGHPINRDGSQVTPNPNMFGGGGGTATVSSTPSGSDIRFDVGFTGRCMVTTTYSYQGIMFGFVRSLIPC